jgi:hypothetical protein
LFEQLISQTPVGADPIASIVAIVVAIGAIATTIGHFVSSNDRFKKYGQYMTTFGQKTVEQEGNLAAMGEAITAISPEARVELAKYGAQLEELKRRAQIAEQQLSKLQGNVPQSAKANNMDDLPR